MTDIKPVRILVTGTRENSDTIKVEVWRQLARLVTEPGFSVIRPVVVVHGQCPKGGVDFYAHQWAAHWGFDVEPHPADWDTYGKRAGPIRNAEMVDLGADYCLGFPAPGSKGTWDCLQRAVNARIPTRVHPILP